jgi:hypothetical protein
MRVDTVSIPQSLIESPKALENKELTKSQTRGDIRAGEPQAAISAPLGSGRTYSLSSLRAAVGYHAKFLTVASSNVEASLHGPVIPRAILDHLNAR